MLLCYYVLFLYAQQHAKDHTEEGREQHLQRGRQQEGDGMGGIPEQRDGLGEDKAVLDVPIDFL